jgi:nucleotide-binding universal stress UspA family protein
MGGFLITADALAYDLMVLGPESAFATASAVIGSLSDTVNRTAKNTVSFCCDTGKVPYPGDFC